MAKDNADNKSGRRKTGSLQSILGGSFLTSGKTAKHLPFLLFLAFLAIIYIGNSYYAEKNVRKIEKLQKEVKELRYEHIYTKSQRVSKSRQSEVANTLSNKGIKESMVPPKKIVVEKN
jgi:hypothetical protein